jgi:AcrR family transcriptional regulator
MGSLLWMEGGGLAWARARPMVESAANFSRARRCIEVTLCFSQTNALETGSEQGFGIDEEVARHRFGRPGQCGIRYRRAARELDLETGCQPTGLHTSDTSWYRNSRIRILSSTGIVVTENSRGRRGRPANEALGQTIVDAARELFVELGFQATTLDKVAQRAKISKLSIYRHFENKEALFSAAMAAGCHQLFAPQALLEGVDGSVEDQLMAVGSLLLRTLLRSDVRSVEAMVMADKTSQKSLSKLHFEAGPNFVIAQIEALLRQLHAKAVLNVPDPLRSARLFAALFKGSDLLMIARFDQAKAEDDNEIESYCRSAVAMFIAAHGGNDHAGGS